MDRNIRARIGVALTIAGAILLAARDLIGGGWFWIGIGAALMVIGITMKLRK